VNNRHCRIRLTPDYANLPVLESFVMECPLLDGSETNRAMLVVTEYFDNIVMHGKGLSKKPVDISVSKNGRVRIALAYRTSNFGDMTAADASAKPYFDSVTRRYRGLGLRMCQNLAAEISYRQGLFKSFITIIL